MTGPVRYILPDVAWVVLLDAIIRDAPVDSVIETHTESMRAIVEQSLAEAGRTDLVLRLVEQPASRARW